jgi:Protein of unknown function (DUF5133)
MLQPHPAALKKAVERYQELRERHAADGGVRPRQPMTDAAYTLCVMTGTRDVETALAIACRQLAPTAAPEPA